MKNVQKADKRAKVDTLLLLLRPSCGIAATAVNSLVDLNNQMSTELAISV
jgi:hypothetical protein